MKLTIKTRGLDSAGMMLNMLNQLGDITGASWMAKAREEDPSTNNAVVAKSLREGGRDIYPEKEDSDHAARVWVDRIEDRLRVLARKGAWATVGGDKIRLTGKAAQRKINDQAAGSALRLAMQALASVMSHNVVFGNYPKVGEAYGRRRQAKFGIPLDYTCRASGQLLENLQGARVKIHKRRRAKSLF